MYGLFQWNVHNFINQLSNYYDLDAIQFIIIIIIDIKTHSIIPKFHYLDKPINILTFL